MVKFADPQHALLALIDEKRHALTTAGLEVSDCRLGTA